MHLFNGVTLTDYSKVIHSLFKLQIPFRITKNVRLEIVLPDKKQITLKFRQCYVLASCLPFLL